jgi:hypothetical protein
MRSKQQLERAKLSPFLESAFSQLLAELPQTRAGYELVKRIESRVTERRKQIWVRRSRPSKGRKRSKKELADRATWFDSHVLGKTVYKVTACLDKARDAATASQIAYSVPVAPVIPVYDDEEQDEDRGGFIRPAQPRMIGQR